MLCPMVETRAAYEVAVCDPIRIPVRDGTELAASIYRPALDGAPIPGAFPSILERTPYERRRPGLHLMGKFFAAHGYNVVLQDVRGRGDSDGTFAFTLRSHEAEDGYDSVEWIAGQAWSDGRVGTTGLSFAGANQQALAVLRPPHLTTQIILDCGYNYWATCSRTGGAFQEGLLVPYVFRMALTSKEAGRSAQITSVLREACADLDHWIRSLPLRRGASPLALVPTYEDWFFDMAARGDYDDVWKDPMPSFQEHIADYPDIPVCFVTSWYGMHASATAEKVTILKAKNKSPVHATFGIWPHAIDYMQECWAGETDFGSEAAVSLTELRLRWFDRFLKEIDRKRASPSPFRLFVMGGGSGRRTVDDRMCHGGVWRDEQAWPPSRTQFQDLYLHQEGALLSTPPAQRQSSTSYTFDPKDPVPTVGGQTMTATSRRGAVIYAGGYDQRGRADLVLCRDTLPLAARQDVLVFRSVPLEEPVEITGPILVHLFVSSTASDTDFIARLIDEYPSTTDYPAGFALNLCDTIIRMRYRNGNLQAALIEPSRVYDIVLNLPGISNRFGAGHRIRLDITSSSAPQYDVNPNTGGPLYQERGGVVARNTVLHDTDHRSLVRLPVIPSTDSIAEDRRR
jgi:uncharacterized protein